MNGISTEYQTANAYAKVKDGTQKADNEQDKKQDGVKDTNVIYGGTLKLMDDPIGEKQAEAQKEALKTIMDTFSGEHKLDEEAELHQAHSKEMDGRIKENQKYIRDLDAQSAELMEEYAIDPEGQEAQDTALLKKARDAKNAPWKQIYLTEEESASAAELNSRGLTEYQTRELDNYKMRVSYEKENYDSRMEKRMDKEVIRAINMSKLEQHDMIDSQKLAQEILEQASAEATGMMAQQAMEHIDEELEESKDKEEESDDIHNVPKTDNAAQLQDEMLKAEAEKRVREQKMAAEDLLGLEYDKEV